MEMNTGGRICRVKEIDGIKKWRNCTLTREETNKKLMVTVDCNQVTGIKHDVKHAKWEKEKPMSSKKNVGTR